MKIKILTAKRIFNLKCKENKIKNKLPKQPKIKTKNSFKKDNSSFFFMLIPVTLKEITSILEENKFKTKICENSWNKEEIRQIKPILFTSYNKNHEIKNIKKKETLNLILNKLKIIISN